MPDLIVDDLALRYDQSDILRGVSVAVPAGKVVALLGPSGSGKTTLLRAVAGLERPHRGAIRIGGKVLFDAARKLDLPAEARGLGLVFQSYALWPHRTVFANVAYGLKLRGVGAAELERRVAKALAQIGLAELAERYPHQLSGGQQQRVALARARSSTSPPSSCSTSRCPISTPSCARRRAPGCASSSSRSRSRRCW